MTTKSKALCPICEDTKANLIYPIPKGGNIRIIQEIRNITPDWEPAQGLCPRCLDNFKVLLLHEKNLIPDYIPGHTIRTINEVLIPPTPVRMNANPYYSGRGITICMIDSGFYPHPDLIQPENRILKVADITNSGKMSKNYGEPNNDDWHGTMTTVACAGNGRLSNGVYKGIASSANLVLLKVKDKDGISGKNITKAIRWAIKYKDKYNIRIINLSLGDDYAISYKESIVDKAAEDAISAGIVVVAAAGNDLTASFKPPANSPNVITVGGLDDNNSFDPFQFSLYHSTYGRTVDNISKPELIAPAIWIAAPILPQTQQYLESEALYKIYKSPDIKIKTTFNKEKSKTRLKNLSAENLNAGALRSEIKKITATEKFISEYYMHVDGTSFAAPIVCSVVAQMLEANPALTPAHIREILLMTALLLPTYQAIRQGMGTLNARGAVERAEIESHKAPLNSNISPFFDLANQKIVFYFHDHNAVRVLLVGNFTQWGSFGLVFRKDREGWWRLEMPMLPHGEYFYKFKINDNIWITDPRNPNRVPDGYNGFNSRFEIA